MYRAILLSGTVIHKQTNKQTDVLKQSANKDIIIVISRSAVYCSEQSTCAQRRRYEWLSAFCLVTDTIVV